jgi:hypothetical protein
LDAAVARIRSLLDDIYGRCAQLALASADGVTNVTINVPYEHG